MARTAVTRLQQQIDEVRREGFAAGYATAMQAIRKLAWRSAPEPRSSEAAPRRLRRVRQAAPAVQPTRRVRANGGTTMTRRVTVRRSQRGTNARLIGESCRHRRHAPCDQRRSARGCRTKVWRWRSPRSVMRWVNWRRAMRPSRSATARPGVTEVERSDEPSRHVFPEERLPWLHIGEN
jgi:hypothetical protein